MKIYCSLIVGLVFSLLASMTFASPLNSCPAIDLASKKPLTSLDGKWVYVDFWASWCGPCRDTFPFMNELQKQYKDKLEIVAISVDDNEKDALKFLQKYPANFATYIDSTGACPSEFKVKGMPSSYLISPEGEIVFSKAGFKASSASIIKSTIDKAISD